MNPMKKKVNIVTFQASALDEEMVRQLKNYGVSLEVVPSYVGIADDCEREKVSGERKICYVFGTNILEPNQVSSEFAGFDLACDLRRVHLLRSPIVLVGTLSKAEFARLHKVNRNLNILDAAGTEYLQVPFTSEQLYQLISGVRDLTSDELRDVVLRHTDFWGAWARTVHILETLIRKGSPRFGGIDEELSKWNLPIPKLLPNLSRHFADFKKCLLSEASNLSIDKRLKTLQDFDSQVVQYGTTQRPSKSQLPRVLPKCPPKGYSKLLIADDNPQDYLAATLRSEYRYDVITPQASKLSQAKKLLDEHKPRVILADLYFKTSNRVTEIPDKTVGEQFIRYAIRAENRPLVLVTSKARIKAEDLLRGAFDCSGSYRATNASAVHELIWAAAAARGVSEPDIINGQIWGPELLIRQRLEPYSELLQKLAHHWSQFGSLIRETLNLTKLLAKTSGSSDNSLVDRLISTLEVAQGETDFKMAGVKQLFQQTDEIHRCAKLGTDSTTKTSIRNILHGKIEQFSSVRNAVEHLLIVIRKVETDIKAISRFKELGERLGVVTAQYAESVPLGEFLGKLQPIFDEILAALPRMPVLKEQVQKVLTNRKNLRIIVVEDDPYWVSQIEPVLERLADLYRARYRITFELFDNTDEALSKIEPRHNTHVISNSVNSVPTLAILDICVPRNRSHVERIQTAASGKGKSFDSPESSNGLNLIRTLTEFRYNLPIIVFSTIDSVSDRKKVCGWGVPENSFISKGSNAQEHLMLALIRFVEKSDRYVISRHSQNNEAYEDEIEVKPNFRINGIEIDFPPALFETFSSLFDLCQRMGQRAFNFTEIIENQGKQSTEDSIRILQDHINRIRNKIFETAHRNRIYVDIHSLLQTRSDEENGEYAYELNAEIPSIEDEDFNTRNDDIESLQSRNRVLVIDKDVKSSAEIKEVLIRKGYQVEFTKTEAEAIHIAAEENSDIVIIDEGSVNNPLGLWSSIRNNLTGRDIGIVLTSKHPIEPHYANEAVQTGIPLENLISKSAPNWLNSFFQALENERLRVFVGDFPDVSNDLAFPIVEILDGTDVDTGLVVLTVNERSFRMVTRENSELSRIMVLLLISPSEALSWGIIERKLELENSPSEDDRKNWTRRLRKKIADGWLDPETKDTNFDQAKLILESSSDGLRLNVRTFDLRSSPGITSDE
jgi:DNA-binding response OmpR family regulator